MVIRAQDVAHLDPGDLPVKGDAQRGEQAEGPSGAYGDPAGQGPHDEDDCFQEQELRALSGRHEGFFSVQRRIHCTAWTRSCVTKSGFCFLL